MAISFPSFTRVRQVAETLLVATAGGIALALIGFPAGWLAGAMVFSAAAALAGRVMFMPQSMARVCFVALGISLGAVASPETLAGMATWPLSVAMVCIAMAFVAVGTVTYLRRVHGWDTLTAVFAGTPGTLSQVMALAAECGCDLRAIGIVQTMRVLILSVCIPGGLALFGLADPAPVRASVRAIADAPGELVVLVGAGAIAAFVLARLRFPGAFIFGPLVVSAALHGTGLVHVTLPQWIANMAMIGLGAVAGSRFTGTPFRLVLTYFSAAIGSFMVALVITAVFAVSASLLLSLRISDTVTAYAPGAVDVMMMLALALHLDPVFVGAHHLARFFSVTVALPIVVRYVAPSSAGRTTSGRPRPPKGDGLDD